MIIHPRCPLCDQPCPKGVAWHAWDAHCEGHVRMQFPFAFCWCGARVTPEDSDSWSCMATHLAEEGGLQAHWIAYHLGVTESMQDVSELPF